MDLRLSMSVGRRWCALLLCLPCLAQAGGARVYAAASLTQALGAASAQWVARGHPAPVLVFGGSAALAKQIVAGAPAEVFVSADPRWMAPVLSAQKPAPHAVTPWLGNQLAIIAPKGMAFALQLTPEFAIAKAFEGRWCTGDPATVPVGRYAQEAFTRLGWWTALAPRMVGAEDVNVALGFVARGECAMGVVYASDARFSPAVQTLAVVPSHLHRPIVYPLAVLPGASTEAKAFAAWLRSRDGMAVMQLYGFLPPP